MNALQMLLRAKKASVINSWIDWDEASEAGIASDTRFCLMREGATTTEIAEGFGLSETNRTTTFDQFGAGAGTPPVATTTGSATIVAASDAAAVAVMNAIFTNLTWSVVCKAEGLVVPGSSERVLQFYSATQALGFMIDLETDPPRLVLRKADANFVDLYLTSSPSDTGVVYYSAWSDGTKIYFGYKNGTGKPTKPEDFTEAVSTTITSSGMNTWADISSRFFARAWPGPDGAKFHYFFAANYNIFG